MSDCETLWFTPAAVELPFFIPVEMSISFRRIDSAKWRTDEPIVAEPKASMPDIEEITAQEYDKYIGAEVIMEVGGERKRGVVKSWAKYEDGVPISTCNDN